MCDCHLIFLLYCINENKDDCDNTKYCIAFESVPMKKWSEVVSLLNHSKFDAVNEEYVWTSRYFFSPRIWHHAGRPTTGHSAETIGKNNKHNGRRTIARYPWNNRRSKPEFLQKMNLTNHFHLMIYTRLNDIWNGSSRSIFMILISFKSSRWDEYDSSDNFQVEN